jgi:16S rRNA (guanine527-N7)-methyltransferase
LTASRRRARARSRTGTSSSAPLERWLAALVETPGLTAISDVEAARGALLDDSLRALELVRQEEGPAVDVGSGGGVPGIPLAYALPDREFVLLEAQERKCAFLRAFAPPNVRVVRGRAEEQQIDWAGCALAKALAPPPVAAEWCLPLVRPGGAVVLWVGPSARPDRVAEVAERLGAELDASSQGFFVLRKLGPTPTGFPRRAGMAKKRPLA